MKSKRVLIMMIAALACILPAGTYALSLGELLITSGTGEPFRGEIELLPLTPTSPDEVHVSVPPDSMFQRFGLRKSRFFEQLHYSVINNGSLLLELSAVSPIPDSVTGFLLEVATRDEKTLKKYQLSPALPNEFTFENADIQQLNPGNKQPVRYEIEYINSVPFMVRHSDNTSQQVKQTGYASSGQKPVNYRVRKGDTLLKIATRKKVRGVNSNQMFFAIYRKNAATIRFNKLDKLYVGQSIRLPTVEEAQSVSKAEAYKFKKLYLKHYQRTIRQAKKKTHAGTRGVAARKAVKAKNKGRTEQKRVEKKDSAKKKIPLIKPEKAVKVKTAVAVAAPEKQVKADILQTAKEKRKSALKTNKVPQAADNRRAIDFERGEYIRKIVLLEERLRKTERLLELELKRHAITRQQLSEHGNPVQGDTQHAAGVRGNKLRIDGLREVVAPAGRAEPVKMPAQHIASEEKISSLRFDWVLLLFGFSVLFVAVIVWLNKKQPAKYTAAHLKSGMEVNSGFTRPDSAKTNSSVSEKPVTEQFNELRHHLMRLRNSSLALGENAEDFDAIRQQYARVEQRLDYGNSYP